MTTGHNAPKAFIALMAGAALMTLAACDRQQAETDAADAETVAPQTAASTIGAPAPVQTRPVLRAGLWVMSSESDGISTSTRLCIDRALQNTMSVLGGQVAAGGACAESTVTPRPGGGWAVRTVCSMGTGGRVVTEGVVTGDLDTSWRQEATSTTSGAAVPHMNRTVSQTIEARREGNCPADMRAGDMVGPGGIRLNMVEMAEMAASLAAR